MNSILYRSLLNLPILLSGVDAPRGLKSQERVSPFLCFVLNQCRIGILFSLLFFLSQQVHASVVSLGQTPLIREWLTKAQDRNLATSLEWQRILLRVPRWGGGRGSMPVDPRFFLHPQGREFPDKELNATIEAFLSPWLGDPELDPICMHPRRLKFLINKLNFNIPFSQKGRQQPTCKAYQDWRNTHQPAKLSLVFAANYLNNPASLYGHTFIRLHRDSTQVTSPLLDHAVNFAANPSTENPILYPLFGLTGRFFGTFSLMPYYIKVQEYNNAESRDLWEYPLKFSQDEIDSFMSILWELGPYGLHYWYLDENCSFVILAVLAAAKPSLAAVDEFAGIVSPKDSIIRLLPYDILAEPVRRGSSMAKFSQRRALLNPQEQELFAQQLRHKSLLPEILHQPQKQSKVLDALLDWMMWSEKLAGNRIPKDNADLWKETLKVRAESGVKSEDIALSTEINDRPDLGHLSQRVYLGFRNYINSDQLLDRQEMIFGLRLALHDMMSPPTGYSMEQEITMGDFQAVVHNGNQDQLGIDVERVSLVRILSIPSYDSVLASPAWTLNLGSQRKWGHYWQRKGSESEQEPQSAWLSHRLEGGVGLATSDKQSLFRAWMIPVVEVGHLLPSQSSLHGGLGLRSGVIWDPLPSFRTTTMLDLDRIFTPHQVQNLYDLSLNFSSMLKQQQEWRLGFHYLTGRTLAAQFTGMVYF